MSVPLDLPILISQLPNMQQIMGPMFVPPEAAQAQFGQLVADNQRKEEQTVQVVEKDEGLEAMGRDTGGSKNPQQHAPQHALRHHPPPPDEQLLDQQTSNASPWTGNIINVKI